MRRLYETRWIQLVTGIGGEIDKLWRPMVNIPTLLQDQQSTFANLQSSLYLAHDENKNDRRVQFGWRLAGDECLYPCSGADCDF